MLLSSVGDLFQC